MTDRWESLPVVCKGGLRQDLERLTQGSQFTGTATSLINYECDVAGGYSRIKGYSKWDTNTVPGSGAVLGVKPALGGVFAVRLNTTSNDIFFSSGSGWGSRINGANRTGSVTKSRMITYSITEPVVVGCDEVNPAWKYNGTTYTLINGAGAPASPKYAEMHLQRLVLAPASNVSSIAISAPNADTTFSGSGAIEINTGDKVVGLRKFRDVLYIFCEHSIKKLVGSSISDFRVEDVTAKLGCLSHDSIQEVSGDLIYATTSGIRSLAATERNANDLELGIVSAGIQPYLKTLISQNLNGNLYSSCVIPAKNQYRLFVYQSSFANIDAEGILARYTDTPVAPRGNMEWSQLKGINAYCADSEVISGGNEVAVFGSPSTGYVYRLDSGNDFDGVAIPYSYISPALTFTNATLRKVLQKMVVYTQVDGNTNITFGIIYDFNDPNVQQPSAKILSQLSSGAVYGSAVYDTSLYSAIASPVFKTNVEGSGFVAAVQFSGADLNPPHRIDSFEIIFSVKGRR